MSPVAPAIIPKSFEHLESVLAQIGAWTHEVQIDIVDGVFAPFTSWPYTEDSSPSQLATLTQAFLIEIDLMVVSPEKVIEEYLRAGVRRIVVHLESTKDIHAIVKYKEYYDFKLGLCINNDTPLHDLLHVVSKADYVQLMGIKDIGSQGQPFDVRVLERIKEIKQSYPTLFVSIDGSVNEETISPLMRAGADRCVSGSAILGHASPYEAYQRLVRLSRETYTL